MAKETYYFSHDANARNDERILMLRAEHGFEGYGIYWALVEMMFEAEETALNHDKLKGIAFSYNVDITKLNSVITTCISEELFCSDGQMFWSESLRRRKEKYLDTKNRKSAAGRKGMEKRWGNKEIHNTVITELYQSNNTDITKHNKGKESKVNESKVKKAYMENVFLTDAQYKTITEKYGEKGRDRIIDLLSSYKLSSGKKYKDDYATMRNWVFERYEKESNWKLDKPEQQLAFKKVNIIREQNTT